MYICWDIHIVANQYHRPPNSLRPCHKLGFHGVRFLAGGRCVQKKVGYTMIYSQSSHLMSFDRENDDRPGDFAGVPWLPWSSIWTNPKF